MSFGQVKALEIEYLECVDSARYPGIYLTPKIKKVTMIVSEIPKNFGVHTEIPFPAGQSQ